MIGDYTPTYYKCPCCKRRIQKHVVKDGARYHVPSWDTLGEHCSTPDCEKNHMYGKCTPRPIFDVYHLNTWKSGHRLKREGNSRATRVYKIGLEMRDDVAYYLFNTECVVFIHDNTGEIVRSITSARFTEL